MAVATPVDLPELIQRFQAVLYGVKAICDAAPTPENRALLIQMEDLVEDLMDLEELAEAREESADEAYATLDDLKSDLGQ